MYAHNLTQDFKDQEMEKRLLIKHFVKKASKHIIRDQDDSEENRTKEHSKTHRDMIYQEVGEKTNINKSLNKCHGQDWLIDVNFTLFSNFLPPIPFNAYLFNIFYRFYYC